jgi:hypothetical protein
MEQKLPMHLPSSSMLVGHVAFTIEAMSSDESFCGPLESQTQAVSTLKSSGGMHKSSSSAHVEVQSCPCAFNLSHVVVMKFVSVVPGSDRLTFSFGLSS